MAGGGVLSRWSSGAAGTTVRGRNAPVRLAAQRASEAVCTPEGGDHEPSEHPPQEVDSSVQRIGRHLRCTPPHVVGPGVGLQLD